jgi:glycosyltransferase involved in cell wall biosynthesis
MISRHNQSKVLFVGTLPPPVTGQSLACKVFHDALQTRHRVSVINLSKRSRKHGIDSLQRILEVAGFIWQAWRRRQTADMVYFTISESVGGNLKDMLICLACGDLLPRTVLHLHGGAGMRELLAPNNRLLRAINAWVLRRVGAVVVLGERHVPMYAGLVLPERLHIVPNFAEDALFLDPARIEAKFADTTPLRLLFLSNLLPGKGHVELLQALSMLTPADQARVQLDLAGGFQTDAQQAKLLQELAAMPQLQVRYHGVVHGERKRALFAAAHLFCLPTYYPYEGQPISILEAYASGCAVLTTDHSGIYDIFDPAKAGFSVHKRSPASIKDALEQALRQPQRLAAMARHNHALASQEYRTDRYNLSLMRILEQLS